MAMAATFVGSNQALVQNAVGCGCRLGKVQLPGNHPASSLPLHQPTFSAKKPTRPARSLRVWASKENDSSKDGGQASSSKPLGAAPPRPGAAPPKMGAAPPKPGAARPKMGPRPEAGPTPMPTASQGSSTAAVDKPKPKPAQGPQLEPVTSVKSPFGESSVDSPFGGAKSKSIFDTESKPKPKNPFGESSAAKPAGKRVKIGTGSGTLNPYGKSTTSARYKPKAESYPGRMPPDFGDSGAKTTTKPSTFRPDSSLFTEKSRIELKQEAQAAEKKWVITKGQVILGLSFVASIGLMIGTFYLVVKVGGVHFNE